MASATFCSLFWRVASRVAASVASSAEGSGEVALGARVRVEEARGDEGHELGRGHLGAVRGAAQGEGVAEEERVRDAEEGARAVLVLHDDGNLPPEERDALHLVKLLRVVGGGGDRRHRRDAVRPRRGARKVWARSSGNREPTKIVTTTTRRADVDAHKRG
jgi:hypothetical protein